MKRLAILTLILFVLGSTARAERITVAVAANFLTTARDITAIFEAETGHDVDLVHGSTGKLFAQIVAGAPFDIYLSADDERPARLVERGMAADGAAHHYATGHLALVHNEGVEPGSVDDILARSDLRVAIADPEVAPYGKAAREILQSARSGVWDRNILRGESVGQAFAFVATGNADVGLVALSQLLTYEGEIWALEVDDTRHSLIQQDAVLLIRAAQSEAAQRFLEFLLSPRAGEILLASGYELPF